jgi:hypothetical protein
MHVGGRGGGGAAVEHLSPGRSSPHSTGVEPGQYELERWPRSHSSGTGWRRRRRRRARRGRVTLEGCSGDDVVLSARAGGGLQAPGSTHQRPWALAVAGRCPPRCSPTALWPGVVTAVSTTGPSGCRSRRRVRLLIRAPRQRLSPTLRTRLPLACSRPCGPCRRLESATAWNGRAGRRSPERTTQLRRAGLPPSSAARGW